MTEPKDLPEAGSSVTYSLVTPNGFPVLFTLRDNNGSALLDRMDKLEVALMAAGFKAQERGMRNGVEPVGQRMCPIHHAPMKEREGKFGKFYSHWDKDKETWCSGKKFTDRNQEGQI